MLVEIERAINGLSIRGLHWSAATLTSLVARSQEKRYGADFLGVFQIRLTDYEVAKGFLAQAKRLDASGNLGAKERKRLRNQCERMLRQTPDSFVFLLSSNPVRVVPAISVVAGDNEPSSLYDHGLRTFFENHFTCFIGDRLFKTSDARTLDDVLTAPRYRPSKALFIGASEEPEAFEDSLNSLSAYRRMG
jgi:hypothetical protein